MPLLKDLEELLLQKTVCKDTANQYRKSIRCFSEFLKRTASRRDLKEPTINRWLAAISRFTTPETLRGRKTGLMVLWNWLALIGKTPAAQPSKLRKVARKHRPPVAWSIPQVRTLLDSAAEMQGMMRCGLPAKQFFEAYIWVAYETGLRPGDILRLRSCDVHGNVIAIVQHKTGSTHVATITDHTRELLEPMLCQCGGLIFHASKHEMRRRETKLFALAKAKGFARMKRQGLGTLRKTHATEVCRQSGIHAAAMSLGHVSGTDIARKYYIQPDALGTPTPPPFLGRCNDSGRINESAGDHCRSSSRM
jgi:integrase